MAAMLRWRWAGVSTSDTVLAFTYAIIYFSFESCQVMSMIWAKFRNFNNSNTLPNA